MDTKILITAGPTWVAVDAVRVLSNTATGETGVLLARKFASQGCKVTLLLGPGAAEPENHPGIKLLRFRYYSELRALLERELKKNYRAVIHSAAVADYRPVKIVAGKLRSGIRKLDLVLEPTPKLLDSFKKTAPDAFVTAFKYEPRAGKRKLICEARDLIRRSRADLVVANTVTAGRYMAFLVDKTSVSRAIVSKKQLVKELSARLGL